MDRIIRKSENEHAFELIFVRYYARSSGFDNNVIGSNSVTIQEINTSNTAKGKSTLIIKLIDPGVVIDKVEIEMKREKNSNFGIPETYYTY